MSKDKFEIRFEIDQLEAIFLIISILLARTESQLSHLFAYTRDFEGLGGRSLYSVNLSNMFPI